MDTNTYEWKGRVSGCLSGPRKKFGFAGQMRYHAGFIEVCEAVQDAFATAFPRAAAAFVALFCNIFITVFLVHFCR